MFRKFVMGWFVGASLMIPVAVSASSDVQALENNPIPGGLAVCCGSANPSCLCGSYSCCEANCQKEKDKGGTACLVVNCADRCAAKYPPL